MTSQEAAFIERRKAQIRYWPWLGGGLIVAFVLFGLYAYFSFPLYMDPSYLVSQLRNGKVTEQGLAQLAVFGSFALVACFAFIVTMLIYPFLALANEKRLIEIIERDEVQRVEPVITEIKDAL